MINLFLDCEFTHLQHDLNSLPESLVSIGIAGEESLRFYAENADVQSELYSPWVVEYVLPLMEGGDNQMPYAEIARRLREWIEILNQPCKLWTDAPAYDWPPIQHLFDTYGWPCNIVQKPIALAWVSSIQNQRFRASVKDIFRNQRSLRQHHALDDAVVNMMAYKRVTARRY